VPSTSYKVLLVALTAAACGSRRPPEHEQAAPSPERASAPVAAAAPAAPAATDAPAASDATAVAAPWQPAQAVSDSQATIVLDPAALALDHPPTAVTITGTFNAWGERPALPLQRQADGRWSATFSRRVLGVPGNSGTTELQFLLDGDHRITAAAATAPRFANNFVVLWPGFSAEQLAQRDAENQTFKEQFSSPAELANFRALHGGQLAPARLFRSYHPFSPSRGGSVEQARLRAVQQLMAEHHIAAVINLSDPPGVVERAPPFYQQLAAAGGVLFAPTHYHVVYFGSAEAEFAAVLRQVLTFIAGRSGPYLLHCQLGTDRTGVVTAILLAASGVPWPEILDDYVRSNQLGIGEYRAPELLTYSLTQFLGGSPADLSPRALTAATRAKLAALVDAPTMAAVVQHLTR
jgi:Tyrosine phosphatase family